MDDRSTIIVQLALTAHELRCAARLGGLQLTVDGRLPDWELPHAELMQFFVQRGLRHALYESFDRAYPPRYPDDEEPERLSAISPFWPWEVDR